MTLDQEFKKNVAPIARVLDSIFARVKKIPLILGRNAFLWIIVFILLEIIFAELLFYQYIFLPELQEPQTTDMFTSFHDTVYNEILKRQEERQKIFNQ